MFRFSGHIARRAALAAFVSSRFIGGSSASAEAEPPAPGNLKPWENRWSNHVTGWHVAGPHPLLVRHAAHLFPPDPPPGSVFKNQRRVLIPLCGKDVSMAHLLDPSAGYPVGSVVGIDGVAQAAIEFARAFPTLALAPHAAASSASSSPSAHPTAFHSRDGRLTFLVSDFFAGPRNGSGSSSGGEASACAAAGASSVPGAVAAADPAGGPETAVPPLGAVWAAYPPASFDACWDRAALVAVDPLARRAYAATLARAMTPGGRVLMVCFDRRAGSPAAVAGGPPFGVSHGDVRELFGEDFEVTLLSEDDITGDPSNDRFRASGLTSIFESAFLLVRRQPKAE